MNAKLSLSMNKLLLMATLTLGFQGLSAAQTVYDRLEAENLWNLGGNPAGLVNSDLSLAGALKSSMGFQSKTQAVSFAQLYGSFEHGGFRSASEAETPWTMGAETKSLARFGKVTMRGGFSFEQKEGSDVDVYYEGEAPSFLTLDMIQSELEELLGSKVDIVRVRDNMNSLLRQRILRDGIYV